MQDILKAVNIQADGSADCNEAVMLSKNGSLLGAIGMIIINSFSMAQILLTVIRMAVIILGKPNGDAATWYFVSS
ncbi:hypothetical protein [Chitinophaga rhizophila]|uniref:Uncharacterized protein n=1 Tax=Chitinophaga rhizophila TaxID=2866212 RepID=A0ABS7GIJ6_9BACT|nr:hypothetical protein [Chitinophaga rhizophila]MBW8687518.1 hypothetical protein [Chitinophaga rhizophila]